MRLNRLSYLAIIRLLTHDGKLQLPHAEFQLLANGQAPTLIHEPPRGSVLGMQCMSFAVFLQQNFSLTCLRQVLRKQGKYWDVDKGRERQICTPLKSPYFSQRNVSRLIDAISHVARKNTVQNFMKQCCFQHITITTGVDDPRFTYRTLDPRAYIED